MPHAYGELRAERRVPAFFASIVALRSARARSSLPISAFDELAAVFEQLGMERLHVFEAFDNKAGKLRGKRSAVRRGVCILAAHRVRVAVAHLILQARSEKVRLRVE